MQLPRRLFADEPEYECIIRTVPPRFIARLHPDMQGDDVLVPESEDIGGVPVVVEQRIDPRPSELEIQAILAEIAAGCAERGN